MSFTNSKNIVVVNCNYKKFREEKRNVEEKNKKIIRENKKLKRKEILFSILLALLVIAITSFAMVFIWQSVQINPDGPFLSQFDVEPKWIKIIIEVAILLVGLSIFRIFATFIKLNYQKKATSPNLLNEQIHFAEVVENNTIINLKFYRPITNAIGVSQPITFSFDVVNELGVKCDSFASETGKWNAVVVPGVVKTVIDVENLNVLIPYYGDDKNIDSLETAYMQEQIRCTELEQMLAEAKALSGDREKELSDKLAHQQNQNELLQKEVVRKNRIIEQNTAKINELNALYEKEKDANNRSATSSNSRIQSLELENSTLQEQFNEERANLMSSFNAEKETLKKQIEDFADALKLAEEEKARLTDSLKERSEQLRAKTDENEALIAAATNVQQEQEKLIKNVENDYAAKMQAEKASHEKAMLEKVAEYEDLLRNKDLAHQHEVRGLEEEKAEMQVEFDEKYRELSEANAMELEAQRVSFEEERQELLDRLAEEKKETARLSAENKQHLSVIAQLEHNAKSNQIYHTDLKNEIEGYKATIREQRGVIEGYQQKEHIWSSAQTTIDDQKQVIATLEGRISVQEKQRGTLEAQLKSAEEIAVARDKECEQMKSEMERLGDVAKKNASLTQSNNALRNRNKMLTEDNASISKNFEEAQASIKELSDKYAELEKSQDRVTKDLLNLQNKYNASQNYVASLEYDLAQSRKSEEAAKTALSNEVKRNSGASSNEFEELMRKREVQIRKAREDAMKGQNTENNN